jgi:hypothetical protein
VVACSADYQVELDDSGYYTFVVSEPDQKTPLNRTPQPPSWLPSGVNWLPWGSKIYPNILIIRNMLPGSGFSNSVQASIPQCTVNNQPNVTPKREDVEAGGQCAHGVMGDYYPEAAYCYQQTFLNGGWEACKAAQ